MIMETQDIVYITQISGHFHKQHFIFCQFYYSGLKYVRFIIGHCVQF